MAVNNNAKKTNVTPRRKKKPKQKNQKEFLEV
ncbi:hypothetical protein B0H42_001083 [Clostridium saccharobutylicum]|nr:hypothetical protein [Clostridium saccharobutylicum]